MAKRTYRAALAVTGVARRTLAVASTLALVATVAVWLSQAAPLAAAQALGGGEKLTLNLSANNAWPFNPSADTFSPDALLDLRYLNEKIAGQTGFVRTTPDGDFATGDGKPLRFWAVNSDVGREPWVERPLWPRESTDVAQHARFLAKRGVNLVRLHRQIAPNVERTPKAAITDINTQERDGIWRTVAAMKREGIYTAVSPFWSQQFKLSPAWNVPGDTKQTAHGLLFFDPTLRQAYKAWWRALLEPVNPYTGVPLAADASVALWQLQNEDSLLFWTLEGIQGPQRDALERLFAAFVVRKHGSIPNALKAWQGEQDKRDLTTAGQTALHQLALLPTWEMTLDPTSFKPGRRARLADQTEFLTRTMDDFNREMVDFLRRDLKVRAPINAGNWKTASVERLNDAERWSYRAGDVDAVNIYTGGVHRGAQAGWAITPGDTYTDASVLKQPWRLPLALRQGQGRPMIVSEGTWPMPTQYGAEAPLLIAAYSGVSGVDAYVWFAWNSNGFEAPRSANGYLLSHAKWSAARPELLGAFPAAALMHRRGDVTRGPPTLVASSEAALWQRDASAPPELASFDPNRDEEWLMKASGGGAAGADRSAFLTGPVQVTHAPLAPAPKHLLSNKPGGSQGPPQVTWRPDAGWLRVDTARTQAVAAHFTQVPKHVLSDVTVESTNAFASVVVTSMSDAPLTQAPRVLVQVTTRARPAGWRDEAALLDAVEGKPDSKAAKLPGRRITDIGAAPWSVEHTSVSISIANPHLTRATSLDANGMPNGTLPVLQRDGRSHVTLPKTATHVLLQRTLAGP
jgi:hypothetical protein